MKNRNAKLEIEKKLKEMEANKKNLKPGQLKKWIKDNKELLTLTGVTLTWVVEHVDNIREFIEVVSTALKSPLLGKTLDIDSLKLMDEDLVNIYSVEHKDFEKIIKAVALKHNYHYACSPSRNLWIEIEQ